MSRSLKAAVAATSAAGAAVGAWLSHHPPRWLRDTAQIARALYDVLKPEEGPKVRPVSVLGNVRTEKERLQAVAQCAARDAAKQAAQEQPVATGIEYARKVLDAGQLEIYVFLAFDKGQSDADEYLADVVAHQQNVHLCAPLTMRGPDDTGELKDN